MELPVPDEWSIHVPSGGWREIRELERKESDTLIRSQCAAKHNGRLAVQGVCVCACVRACVCVCVCVRVCVRVCIWQQLSLPLWQDLSPTRRPHEAVVSATMPAQHISHPSHFVQAMPKDSAIMVYNGWFKVQGSRCMCVCVREHAYSACNPPQDITATVM